MLVRVRPCGTEVRQRPVDEDGLRGDMWTTAGVWLVVQVATRVGLVALTRGAQGVRRVRGVWVCRRRRGGGWPRAAPRPSCRRRTGPTCAPRPGRRGRPTPAPRRPRRSRGSRRANSSPSTAPSGAASAMTKYVPDGRATCSPDASSAEHSRSRLAWSECAQTGIHLVAEPEGEGHGRLERPRRDVREELLDGARRRDGLGRPGEPADLPARGRERLAARADRDGAVGHPRQGRHRHVHGVVEDEVLVDLVGDDPGVVLARQRRRRARARPGVKTLPVGLCGVLSRTSRVREREGRPQRRLVDREVGEAEHRRAAGRAGEGDRGGIRVVVGLEGDDLVAGLAEREDDRRDRLGRAGGDEHLRRGVERDPVEALLVRGDRLEQLGHAGAGRVLVAARRRSRPWPPRASRGARRCRGSPARG